MMFSAGDLSDAKPIPVEDHLETTILHSGGPKEVSRARIERCDKGPGLNAQSGRVHPHPEKRSDPT
jgi:hypothetical protein